MLQDRKKPMGQNPPPLVGLGSDLPEPDPQEPADRPKFHRGGGEVRHLNRHSLALSGDRLSGPTKPQDCFLLGLTLIILRPMAGPAGFVVIPRGWIVERTLGRLGRRRRLTKDFGELPEVSEAMVTLAAIRMMLQRLVHPGRKLLPAP
jgi:putative transposase